MHEAGFAEIKGDALKNATPITLEPWGKLRGRVLLGTEPDIGREISFSPKRPSDFNRWSFVRNYGYRATTDEEGRFGFDRVIPGHIWIATEDAVLQIDENGAVKTKIPFSGKLRQAWIEAF